MVATALGDDEGDSACKSVSEAATETVAATGAPGGPPLGFPLHPNWTVTAAQRAMPSSLDKYIKTESRG